MYKLLRLRLTVWYIFLSAFTFIAIALVGTALCYDSVTDTLDDNIKSVIYHTLPLVDDSDPAAIKLKAAPETIKTELAYCHATLQLFDLNGKLLGEYGPPGFHVLSRAVESEADYQGRRVRIGSTSIRDRSNQVIGYLQVQEPTETRDKAVLTFILTIGWLAPVLIVTLGISGYLFSEKASKPAEEAFTLLRQFLADAGHELRTPVHLIQLTAENAMIGHEEDSELQHDLNTIVRATDRMGRLVEDMMTLAKMGGKHVKTKTVPVRIDEILADAVSEYVLPAREKGIEMLLMSELEPAIVVGDPDQLYRVVANLIENALRYTDEGGQVRVFMWQSGINVMFSVEDTGIGIPIESLPLIFDRFYRVDKSRARAAGGTGLGLSIVKAICEMHQGEIVVSSVEGVGSTFTVTLPLRVTGAHSIAQTGAHLLRQSGLHKLAPTGSFSGKRSGPNAMSKSGPQSSSPSGAHSQGTSGRHSLSSSASSSAMSGAESLSTSTGTDLDSSVSGASVEEGNDDKSTPVQTPNRRSESQQALKTCGVQQLNPPADS